MNNNYQMRSKSASAPGEMSLITAAASGLPGTNRNVRLFLKGVLASMIFLLPGRVSMAQGFSSRTDHSLGANSWGIAIGDLDGDGKKDIGASTWDHGTIALLRNQSTPGALSFAGVTNVSTNMFTPHVDFGDIDGDGKLDIVNTSLSLSKFSVHQNTSSMGSLSFVNVVNTSVSGPIDLELCDVDGDGKLDVIVISKSVNLVNVYRNTSTPGAFSFAALVSKSTDANPECVTVGDIDGDGKKDIIVTCYDGNSINVFRNTSSSGSVSLADAVSFATDVNPAGVKTGDIDGDSKLDIVVSNHGGSFSTFRNTSSSGVINTSSLASRVDIALSGPGYDGLAIRDVNADGKADVFVGLYGSSYIVPFINSSTTGSVSYTASTPLAVAANALDIIIEDMDGDGYLDIVSGDLGYTSLGIFKGVAPVAATISSSTNVTCIGGSNGSATVSATGGSGSYTYSWAPAGGTSATASGLSAGTYTCTVTGGGTATVSVTITQPSTPLPRILAPADRIVTMAGNGTGTFTGDGGDARYASLKFVVNVCMDKAGNIYIADNNNFRIRKVNTSGIISTIAGNGTSGNTGDGGPATAANINVSAVATDATGNVYFSDVSNNVVRKIGTDGVITRFAGTGGTGFNGDGIQATAATLTNPSALAIDAAGNVYIGSSGSGRIRKVNASGVITTFAGNGTGSGAGDGSPATAVAVAPMNMNFDPSGNLYYVEQGTGRARRISTSGIVNTVAGNGTSGFSGDGGAATAAQLNNPSGIAVDAFGNIFIADASNVRIRKVDASGVITTIAGNGTFVDGGDNGPASAGTFAGMLGLWIDNEQNLLIAQNSGNRLRKIFMNDTTAKLCAGGSGTLRTTSTGGTWSSSSSSVATVGTTGLLSAVAGGTSVITYTLPSGCYGTAGAVVDAPSGAFTVTPSSVCIGTSQAFVSSQASCAGNALSFTASTHQASKSGVISTATQNFTMEAWVKFNGATGAYQVIMHNGNTGGDGYGLILQPSGNTLVLLRGGLANTATGITLPTTGWHHVALVNNAGNWSAYLDGVRSAFSDGSVATPTTGFYVGNSTAGSQRFNGIIDEVTYWNVARTNAQIVADMNACSITTSANLLGYWKFDEASGSTTADASGNGNTLTVTGASRVASSASVSGYAWSFGDGASSTVGTPSRTYTASGTFSPSLSVTDVLGCSASATATDTVVAYPSLSVSSGVTICNGSSTTLTATGATNYSWSPSTGLSATTGASVTATPTATTTYTVMGTTSGCTSSAAVAVSVNASPSAIGSDAPLTATVFAGTGSSTYSGDGGPATAAGLGVTWCVRRDNAGNIYVIGNNVRIRKIDNSGTISTVAGNGTTTYSDGPATATGFNITAVAVDNSGNIYVCGYNHRVVKISPSGIATTIAGTGVATNSGDGGPATAAAVAYPTGLAVDGSGNVYILSLFGTIRKINVSGVISTFAGGGGSSTASGIPATATYFNNPGRLASDAAGNLYVADRGAARVCKITPSGTLYVIAGNGTYGNSGDGGPATAAALYGPDDIAVAADGTVYIADDINYNIRKVNPSGIISTVAGTGSSSLSGMGGPASSASMWPMGIEIDPAGNLYVSTYSNNRIVRIQPGPICIGTTASLTNDISGGTWTSSNTTVATVNASTGVVTGLAAGTSLITYTLAGGCYKTILMSVNALPTISAGSSVAVCTGTSTTLTATGGTTYSWSPATGLSATTGATVTAGPTSTTTYTVTGTNTNGCSNTATVTVSVNSNPPASTGQTFTCAGGSITLSNAAGGGSWSSSNTAIATVGSSTGVVTGVDSGTVNITYALGTGCYTVKSIDVNPPMAAITGSPYVCLNTTSDLDHAMSGGTWSVATPYYATIDASTGVLTGAHSGATTVTYTVNSGCVVTTPVYTSNVILNITGSLSVCEGSTNMLTVPGYAGATWSTPDSATAYINATTGALLGVSAGTVPVTVTYGYCYTSAIATVNPVPASISGGSAVCAGSTLSLSCSTGGGAWSSSNTAKATVNSSGVVTGVTSGTATISYTLGTGCAATKIVSVGAMPASITGTTTVCVGSTTNLACTTLGGTWSSSATGTADVVSGTVTATTSYTTITGVATGGATISYSMPTGCVQTVNVTVATPPSSIGGTLAICSGGSSTLTSSGGGTWSSSLTTVATIGSATGIVTGGATTGTATITYRTSSTCYTTAVATVTTPSAISGPASVCKTYTVTLTHGTGGGTWSSSNTAVATVDATTGVVTGVLAGAVNITYNISTGCFAVKTLQVYNNPSAISGTATMCAGASVSLTGTSGTGTTWSSSTTSVATVGSSTGLVTGVASGNADITYTATSTGCYTTRTVTVNEAPSTITGASAICVGSNETYVSTPTGGTWSSTAPTVGSIDATSGVATGRAGGGTTIKYMLSTGCFVAKAITVNALPVAISGTTLLCVGNTVTLSSTTSGATWSTSAAGTASITATTSTTATVAGISSGMANISYTNGAGCSRVAVVTVNDAVAAIEGPDVVCSGNTITLTNATIGGTWGTSSAVRVGIVSATGVASGGTTVGSAVITYKTSAACFAIKYVTNNAAVANIAGTTSVCVDATTTFTNSTSGGTWSSSGTIAMVDAASGVITGMSAGTNTISYVVSEGCYKTKNITVTALPSISGAESVAVGATTTLTGAPTPGTWISATPGIATISSTGVVTGIAAGTVNISYYAGGCTGTWPMSVTGSASSRPVATADQSAVEFSVFPNPTHGSLSVSTDVAGTFAIYTVDGKLASTSELAEGVNAINMPAGLAAGTYLCRFLGVDGSVRAVRLVFEP